MLKKDVKVGKVYAVKVSGKIVPVEIMEESIYGKGWNGKNLITKRDIRIRTGGKLRVELVKAESGKWKIVR